MKEPETTAQPSITPEEEQEPGEVEEQEPEEVEEQAKTGEDEPGGEVTKEGDEAATEPKSNEMKVLIAIDGENIMVGVKTPDTDPVFTKVEGDLASALQQVPQLIEDAKAKWATSPRYPEANLPKPPAPAPAAPARRISAAAPPKPNQPTFF
uniref:Putative von Willebrand domain containing protein n=1 Tax=viral metagenome TaxID=1070528 RepID=A0A6M3M007_9ZZZZ